MFHVQFLLIWNQLWLVIEFFFLKNFHFWKSDEIRTGTYRQVYSKQFFYVLIFKLFHPEQRKSTTNKILKGIFLKLSLEKKMPQITMPGGIIQSEKSLLMFVLLNFYLIFELFRLAWIELEVWERYFNLTRILRNSRALPLSPRIFNISFVWRGNRVN